MKTYSYQDKPIKIYGIPYFEVTKELRRLPDVILEKYSYLNFYGRRCPGARMCFRTDAKKLRVRLVLKTLSPDMGLSLYSCQSAKVLIGSRNRPYYAGLVGPKDYDTKAVEEIFTKAPVMEDITIFFPRNEIVENIEIAVEDEATVEAPTPYKYGKPVLFYGSSITEGGCCCNVTNAYNAILSNRLDFDYYNFGFSGSAKGEPEMAEYISKMDISAFVYDYDHNAPTVEHLAATHEPFFRIIRRAKPDIPILMMTRPQEIYGEDEKARREVVRKTYQNALDSGDQNVYFIDGETFYGVKERHLCSIDVIHPNDLGFHRMADVIEPVLKTMLKRYD